MSKLPAKTNGLLNPFFAKPHLMEFLLITYKKIFLRKPLYKSVTKSLSQCNIKVIFQSKIRLSSLLKFKDSIPLYLRSHLIYKSLCSNCNITYYGETERHLKVEDGEHVCLH